jgi:WD40 repeat protein
MLRRGFLKGVAASAFAAPLAAGDDSVRTFKPSSGYSVYALAYAPDGRTFLSGDGSGDLTLWDLTTGDDLNTFPTDQHGIQSAAFSRDGNTAT